VSEAAARAVLGLAVELDRALTTRDVRAGRRALDELTRVALEQLDEARRRRAAA
jgi:hypothetical protein